jgi:hypothetical protein
LKSLILLLILLTASIAQARSTYQITCSYQFETFYSIAPMKSTFTVSGQKLKNGTIIFHHYQQNIPSYYFPEYNYGAHWHREASFLFNASLIENELIYTYQFNNYLRKPKEIKNVFYESYRLSLNDNDENASMHFYYADGTLEKSLINKDPWINSSHVQLLECELQSK